MQCRLCLQYKPLIKKSHIIPDFMYKGLFDDKHRIAQKDFVINRDSIPYNGIYDKHILCKSCDNNIIGGFESYAAKELFKPNMHGFIHSIKEIFNHYNKDVDFKISKLDYRNVKLFLLSILWRASISIHPLFKFVKLNDNQFEEIRKMLFIGLPCKSDTLEIVIAAFIPDGTRPYFSIGPPRLISYEEVPSYYTFIINSFLFYFNIRDYNKDLKFQDGYINENGDMKIVILDEDGARDIFDGLVGRNIKHQGPFMQ